MPLVVVGYIYLAQRQITNLTKKPVLRLENKKGDIMITLSPEARKSFVRQLEVIRALENSPAYKECQMISYNLQQAVKSLESKGLHFPLGEIALPRTRDMRKVPKKNTDLIELKRLNQEIRDIEADVNIRKRGLYKQEALLKEKRKRRDFLVGNS